MTVEHDVVDPPAVKPYVAEAVKLFGEGLTDPEVAKRVQVPRPVIERLRQTWERRVLQSRIDNTDRRLHTLEENVGAIAENTRTLADTMRRWEEPMGAVMAAIQRQQQAQGGTAPGGSDVAPPGSHQGAPAPPALPPQGGGRNPQDLEALKLLVQAGSIFAGPKGGGPMEGMMMQFFTTFMGAQTENIKSQASLNNILAQAMAKRLGVVAGEMVNAAFD